MMTREHFQAIADIIKDARYSVSIYSADEVQPTTAAIIQRIAYDLADFFAGDNPNFDRDRFFRATYPKERK